MASKIQGSWVEGGGKLGACFGEKYCPASITERLSIL